jgi:7-carboxy-7-deazaguanine synthase
MNLSAFHMSQTLKIHEIFFSIQGEGPFTGMPTTFVRLTGCPLRCQYCDTAYAFKGGTNLSLEDIFKQVRTNPTKHICITGGEPLAQSLVHPFITQLCDNGYQVSIETSGSLSIKEVDSRATCIMDIKTPGSGEVEKNLKENIMFLRPHDHIKFVICDQNDFNWSIQQANYLDMAHQQIWFSPEHQTLSATTLADWMIETGAPYRLQIQLHKHLWGDVAGK